MAPDKRHFATSSGWQSCRYLAVMITSGDSDGANSPDGTGTRYKSGLLLSWEIEITRCLSTFELLLFDVSRWWPDRHNSVA